MRRFSMQMENSRQGGRAEVFRYRTRRKNTCQQNKKERPVLPAATAPTETAGSLSIPIASQRGAHSSQPFSPPDPPPPAPPPPPLLSPVGPPTATASLSAASEPSQTPWCERSPHAAARARAWSSTAALHASAMVTTSGRPIGREETREDGGNSLCASRCFVPPSYQDIEPSHPCDCMGRSAATGSPSARLFSCCSSSRGAGVFRTGSSHGGLFGAYRCRLGGKYRISTKP